MVTVACQQNLRLHLKVYVCGRDCNRAIHDPVQEHVGHHELDVLHYTRVVEQLLTHFWKSSPRFDSHRLQWFMNSAQRRVQVS